MANQLPPLRLRQIWQCRDQRFTAVVISLDEHVVKYSYLTAPPDNPYGIGVDDCVYRRPTRIVENSHATGNRHNRHFDFTNLLYEP